MTERPIDIGDLCDCVAGGTCRRPPTVKTMHRVHLFWADPIDSRDPDTVASPAQLDDWIRSGVITGAFCPICQDGVNYCPSFSDFLRSPRWDDDEIPEEGHW